MTLFELRHRLMLARFSPIPVTGRTKRPAIAKGWQTRLETNDREIELWDRLYPGATSTGILCKLTPAIDIDILDLEAAEAVEALVRERFEELGRVLVRIGRAPKRAILFRTDEPFDKIQASVLAPNDPNGERGEKLELLCDGQQLVAFGIHEKTGKPYQWHGGEPGEVKRGELPYLAEAEARALVHDATELLIAEHGYKRAPSRPKKRKAKEGNGADVGGGAEDWSYLTANILAGRELHDSLRDLACKLIASGMGAGAAVNHLRGLMDASAAPHDDRWKERRDEIPRLVESAATLPPQDAKPELPPITIAETLKVFEKWLTLSHLTPVYAVLGTVAANLLPGDPVWLGLIAPPSSAKTEILNSTSRLPYVVQAATVTPAGWLSGTPKKQRDKSAKGGLLQQIGKFGIVVLKDFESVISMRPDARNEALAALREIFDGSWIRVLGTDGGRTLSWQGKIGLIFGATGVLDSHYSIIGAMGDRFLLCRLGPTSENQFTVALKHLGTATGQMRAELAEAVTRLFAGRLAEPRQISDAEIARINRAITLVVRLRGAVERDRYSRDIEAIYGAEGTARIGLALERLLAGLDTLGVERETALGVVTSIALDSVPPLRRRVYEHLCGAKTLLGGQEAVDTPTLAAAMGLPTITVRRALEDIAAYGLVSRESGGRGGADRWTATPP